MNNKDSARLFFIFFLFVILFSATILRLFYWQVVEAQGLSELGRIQSAQELVNTARRGDILFSDGFPLATNEVNYLLYANPKQVDSIDTYATRLASPLGLDAASISALLSKDLYWVRLKDRLEYRKKEEIESLKLEALGFEQQSTRFYPEASIAAHLVGFVGKDEQGEDEGYFGLEGFYNKQLQGREGSIYMVKDALGNPILTDVREEKTINGRTLITSIDRTVQFITDRELKKAVEKYKADGGSVIIMEPKTGKILAMDSYPKFDPQEYYEYDGTTYKSPIVSSLYEPGSTFKVLVMAAAMDMGLVEPSTKCDICAAPVEVGEYSIKTWNDKYYANTTMTDVVQHSDNTGMVYAGRKLGISNMLAYFSKFGLGRLTNIDLQGEATGTFRNESEWSTIDLATASFGQGISITPIQLLTAVASLANGGELMRPMLVSKIITENGKEIEIKPENRGRTVSGKASKLITWMMVNAVEKGEAKWVKIPNFPVAGKTGTAQIPVAGHYDPNKTIASFVGFFPPDNPRIAMLVLMDKPKTSIYGSETAAPLFFNIARSLIQYYNIAPTQ